LNQPDRDFKNDSFYQDYNSDALWLAYFVIFIKIFIMRYILLFSIIYLVCTGCNKKPAASFALYNTELEAQSEVLFTNTSENAGSYSWDFGDGNSSTDESPTHIYSKEGTYIVELTAYATKNKKFHKFSKKIIIGPKVYFSSFTLNGTIYDFFTNDGDSQVSYVSYYTSGSQADYVCTLGGANYVNIVPPSLVYSTSGEPTGTQFYNFLNLGNYDYSFGANPLREGFDLTFSINGDIWQSNTYQQSNAAFNIMQIDNFVVDQVLKKNVVATFNCTVWNQFGDSAIISNGTVSCGFINDF